MSDEADLNRPLSELGALFLSHLDDIKAGRAALEADIQNLLAGLAKRARADGQRDVSADAHGVQWTRTVGTLNLPVVLRLGWAWDALPEFSLTTEPPAELVEVFPADLMSVRGWPTTTAAALSDGAARELWQLWQKAVADVEDEIARRSAAVAVMQDVSRGLSAEIKQRKFPKTKFRTEDAGKTVKIGRTWPCFVQWQFAPDGLDRPVYCDVSYWPSGRGPAGAEPALKLVFYNGEQILKHLGPVVDRFQGKQPVLVDWSDKLLDFKGDDQAISDLAKKIVKESMDRYAAVLKKMGLVK